MGLLILTPLKGVSAPSFSPLDLSPSLWLDATDSTTINSGSPTSGVSVTSILDKSGGSHTFTNTTGGNRPTWVTGQLNGKPSLNFASNTGTNDSQGLFNTDTLISGGAAAQSLAVVYTFSGFPSPSDLSGQNQMIFNINGTGTRPSLTLNQTQPVAWGNFGFGNGISGFPYRMNNTSTFIATGGVGIAAIVTFDGVSTMTFNNGSTSQTVTSASGTQFGNNGMNVLGCWENNFDYGFNGNISELVFGPGVWTPTQIGQLATYFTNKYGTP